MPGYKTENNFVIAEGSDGDLYFFLNAKNNHPNEPKIIYDGKDHALLLRSPEECIILDYINPEIRDKLRKSKEVVVVETLLDNIKESYFTPLQIVDSIPLNWKQAGLGTWEDLILN